MSFAYTRTPHQKINTQGISSQWEGKHLRFPCVSIGEQNRIKATAPPESKDQFNILINDIKKTGISGWHVWCEDSNWYHLGGSTSKKPTIYELNSNGRSIKIKVKQWNTMNNMGNYKFD